MKNCDEENLDVLQNIEFAIVEVYRADRCLLDLDAKDAVDALVRHYHAQEEHRTAPVLRLGERATRVFEAVQSTCEWRLGRAPFAGENASDSPIPMNEMIACLRRIQKSIPRWSRQGGRKGYLDFVSQYIL